jgi:hypothetical protein
MQTVIVQSRGAVVELLLWLIATVALAYCGTAKVRVIPPYLTWTPLHILPFAALIVGSYRAGRHFLPTPYLVAFGLLCTAGILPLLLPDVRGRYALRMEMVSVWFYVIRTAAFSLALPIICAYSGMVGRRRELRAAGHCACSYDLTGNVSGRCPECGRPIGAGGAK